MCAAPFYPIDFIGRRYGIIIPKRFGQAIPMKFKDVAYGAFIFAIKTEKSPAYQRMVRDQSLLTRLQTAPSYDDFEKLRKFLIDYGVPWAPKDLATRYTGMWPKIQPYVKQLATENLETCNLNNTAICDAIESAYNCLQNVWGDDAVAGKALHFFNVSLFVMWDTDISNRYCTRYKSYGGAGYRKFLTMMQENAIEITNDFHDLGLTGSPAEYLSSKIGYTTIRPLTKFMDDYNWMTITKSTPATLPDWLLPLFK